MATFTLRHGHILLLDDVDAHLGEQYNWFPEPNGSGTCYAIAKHEQARLTLHRILIDAPCHLMVDHINGNGLDNRRSNLRLATNSQNQANRRLLSLNTSGFRGVTFNKACNKWQAGIKLQGKSYHLGLFTQAEDAARAYDQKSIEMFGEFARLNFPIDAERMAAYV